MAAAALHVPAALHARCQRNLKLMAAKKELPLQMGEPVCAKCAFIQNKRKKRATQSESDSETEMFSGYDMSDSFVNDGSIDESEWTEDEQEQKEKVQGAVKKKCRKLNRPPVEESEDES